MPLKSCSYCDHPGGRHAGGKKFQYSRITPHIYVGTNMMKESHFQKLKKLGISVDIDFEAERIEKIPLGPLKISQNFIVNTINQYD